MSVWVTVSAELVCHSSQSLPVKIFLELNSNAVATVPVLKMKAAFQDAFVIFNCFGYGHFNFIAQKFSLLV